MNRKQNLPISAIAGAGAIGFVAGALTGGARRIAAQAFTTGAKLDWFEALKNEHRLVEAQFVLLEATSEEDALKRTAILEHIAYGLSKHAIEEENIIYPALRAAAREGMAKHLYDDHSDVKTFIYDLRRLPRDDPQWLTKLKAFHALISDHVRREEEDIYPAFHAEMSAEANADLSRLMQLEGLKVA